MIGRIFLGRYETVRLLGEGGMGRVYLARQLDLGRQVVVKIMHDHVAADPHFRERFQRETLLMARFQHPYAVTLYDASLNDPEGPCIIMEYIKGVTLDVLLERNGRLSPPRVGRLLGQLGEVLQAAHAEGIVHRDLKPANLMVVDPDSPYEKIKVMDFGLATMLDPISLKKLTDTKAEFAVGTPGYISPEQVRGDAMDHRGDLYSVGVILFELLCGKLPFTGASSMEVMLAHANEEPPSFAKMGAGEWVPPSVEAVIRACLAKDPSKRPANARELIERYETALDHEQVALQQALPPQHPRAQHSDAEDGAAAPVPAPARKHDPTAVIHELDAWMPERIAAYKLFGFVQDVGGQVVESVPGRIRVHLGGPLSAYGPRPGPLSWLGIGRKAGQIEMELNLHRADPGRDNMLHITVAMRSLQKSDSQTGEWRARCNQIFCDLRGYLLGQSGSIAEAAG
jgi:eukaryotic-like serine/threonine-protein kinase